MVDKIEMSLDEIIKATKTGKGIRKGGRGGVRKVGGSPRKIVRGGFRSSTRPSIGSGGGVLKGRNRGGIIKAKYARGDVNSAWKHDLYDGPKRAGGLKLGGGTKLLVLNLDYGVSESDIRELFAEFGPLKSASVHYDRSGRSLGTADVVFERRSDGVKAMKQYHGVPLDGRPMNIQMATSEIPSTGTTGGLKKPRLPPSSRPIRGGPNRRQIPGRGGSVSRGRGRTTKAPAPTAEELDAELDAYVYGTKN